MRPLRPRAHGQPEAYISAFSKLARQNKDDPCPHWLEVFWLHDHPPIGERLAMASSKVGWALARLYWDVGHSPQYA